MNVFLSYAWEQVDLAAALALSLRDEGDTVFFDRASLQPGERYDKPIRDAIEHSDLFLFLVSPDSVVAGCYALAELGIAEEVRNGKPLTVLPVMAAATDFSLMPSSLQAVYIIQPRGDVAAEALAEAAKVRESLREPVSVSTSITGGGWTLHFHVPDEPLRRLSFRFDGDPTFRTTGESMIADPRGFRQANLSVSVPRPDGRRELLVKYVDARKRKHGPFSLTFDADEQLVAAAKQWLQHARTQWIMFSEQKGQLYAFFTTLLMWKNAFREIRFSVNSDSVSRSLRLRHDRSRPEWNDIDFENDQWTVLVSNETRYVAVKLIFINGSESPIERFTRR